MIKRVLKAFVGLAAGLAVHMAASASTVTYYHNDLLGSPAAATDASGNVVWRESYRPYGERLVNSAAATGNQIWFTGRRQDPETGLVYMGARYYDPITGRFVSTDPKMFDPSSVMSFNRYAYANDNPFSYKDPNGKWSVTISENSGDSALDAGARAFNERTRAVFEGARQAIANGVDWYITAVSLAVAADTGGASVAARGAIAAAEAGAAEGAATKVATEVVQRAMSRAELEATESTGLLRGGRPGIHYVSDAIDSDPQRARELLSLQQTPEVRVTMEVPAGRFSPPSRVAPNFNMPGGGIERTATGDIPVRIQRVDPY